MVKFPLMRPLARLFTYLFYGQIALYLFSTPILIFMTSRNDSRLKSHLSTPRDAVVIDSIRVGGKMIAALHDTTGTFRMNVTSYPAALTITSVQAVDSVFRTNLNVDAIWTKDGYYVKRPTRGSSFGYRLPLGGRVSSSILARGYRDGIPSDVHRSSPWYHRLRTDGPTIKLTEPIGPENDELSIEMSSWGDWLAVPRSLKLAVLMTLLPAFFSVLVAYQFMKLFGSMTRHEVFSELQLRRVYYIGYYALLYVFMRMICDLYKVLAVRRYVVGFGYEEEYLFQNPVWATLTIQWAWLLMGLCILALAQVFKYGMELKQENELTV